MSVKTCLSRQHSKGISQKRPLNHLCKIHSIQLLHTKAQPHISHSSYSRVTYHSNNWDFDGMRCIYPFVCSSLAEHFIANIMGWNDWGSGLNYWMSASRDDLLYGIVQVMHQTGGCVMSDCVNNVCRSVWLMLKIAFQIPVISYISEQWTRMMSSGLWKMFFLCVFLLLCCSDIEIAACLCFTTEQRYWKAPNYSVVPVHNKTSVELLHQDFFIQLYGKPRYAIISKHSICCI